MENSNHVSNISWSKEYVNNVGDDVVISDDARNRSSNNAERSNRGLNNIKGVMGSLSTGNFILLIFSGVLIVFVGSACVISALHRINQGHVGVYFKNGALLNEISDPGLHWSQPFVTTYKEVMTIPETKVMNPLICTTRDGVRNVFRDVQVISSIEREKVHMFVKDFSIDFKKILIYDRIGEALQSFCANHSIDEVYNTQFLEIRAYINESLHRHIKEFAPPGIKIWNLFLPKPEVPPAIAANYRQVKVEWTQQLVAQERQKTEKIKKNTEKIKAILKAQTEKEVEQIEIAKKIQREEGKRNVTRISTQTQVERERIEADTSSYVDESHAKSNKLLLTDKYIQLQLIKSLTNTTKVYLSGQNNFLGSLIERLLGSS